MRVQLFAGGTADKNRANHRDVAKSVSRRYLLSLEVCSKNCFKILTFRREIVQSKELTEPIKPFMSLKLGAFGKIGRLRNMRCGFRSALAFPFSVQTVGVVVVAVMTDD